MHTTQKKSSRACSAVTATCSKPVGIATIPSAPSPTVLSHTLLFVEYVNICLTIVFDGASTQSYYGEYKIVAQKHLLSEIHCFLIENITWKTNILTYVFVYNLKLR